MCTGDHHLHLFHSDFAHESPAAHRLPRALLHRSRPDLQRPRARRSCRGDREPCHGHVPCVDSTASRCFILALMNGHCIANTELTVRRNRHSVNGNESKWGLGQILALLPVVGPMLARSPIWQLSVLGKIRNRASVQWKGRVEYTFWRLLRRSEEPLVRGRTSRNEGGHGPPPKLSSARATSSPGLRLRDRRSISFHHSWARGDRYRQCEASRRGCS